MDVDLAAERAAARERRTVQTARALREARLVAVRAAARPGCTREDLEALALSFYPRLGDALRDDLVDEVWDHPSGATGPDPAGA